MFGAWDWMYLVYDQMGEKAIASEKILGLLILRQMEGCAKVDIAYL
jgi:hypothetical protein